MSLDWDNSDLDCPDLRSNPKNCRLCETGQRRKEESKKINLHQLHFQLCSLVFVNTNTFYATILTIPIVIYIFIILQTYY